MARQELGFRLKTVLILISLSLIQCSGASAQSFAGNIDKIIHRPEYRRASFGIEFYSLDTNKPVYQLNSDRLFVPASTTKLLTEGAALELLGGNYRFHTRVYRTGPISADGTLLGDLVLVASGDPNLSGRIQPDGTLAFENDDHSYSGSIDTRAVPGDPLLVLHELARQVAAHRIKRIAGRVIVDASLFPEGQIEEGTDTVVSPVSLNDNLVDVTVAPGRTTAQSPSNRDVVAAAVTVSPNTPYVQFINQAITGTADSDPDIRFSDDRAAPDGSHTVTITGSVPAGKPPILFGYRVPQPSRFAEMALAGVLRDDKIVANDLRPGPRPDLRALAAWYRPDNLVAEHVSPPLSEEVKVTLKTSQNLHATMIPYLLGALKARSATNGLDQAGLDLEREFLLNAGLDVTGVSQDDGAGVARSAYIAPDFMVQYLAYMARQKDFPLFYDALPVLGRDGTLWNIQTDSSGAGQIHAKTGTFGSYDGLNRNTILNGKGLAGYLTTPAGAHLAFAIYANNIPLPADQPDAAQMMVGQALGEIAAAAYAGPPVQEQQVSASSGPHQIEPGSH